MILELKCIDCKFNDKIFRYEIDLIDASNKKYYLSIHDYIPLNSVVKMNTFYHDLKFKGELTEISVKQRYKDNQPTLLELEIIDAYALNDGIIFTMQDTNTADIFKLKAKGHDFEVGRTITWNFKELNMIVITMPHFYTRYIIENWIFINNIIDTL